MFRTAVLLKVLFISVLVLPSIGPASTVSAGINLGIGHAAVVASAAADTGPVVVDGLQPPLPSQGIPLTFIENVGQFDARVRFQARSGNTTLSLTDDALWVSLNALPSPSDPVAKAETSGTGDAKREAGYQVNLKLSFPGAASQPRLEPFSKLDAAVSFFTGNDPSKWRTDVAAWGGVRYVDLYPGIDLEVIGLNGQLAPRLVVRKPSSLQDVRLQVEGADDLTLEGDHLRLVTALGDFALPLLALEGAAPVAEPAISAVGKVFEVTSPFAAGSSLAASTAPTSASTLFYSTYLGGSGADLGYDIALDEAGNIYVAGNTSSMDFPTKTGAYNSSYNGGAYDVFVAKLSADGRALQYSTYLGGSGEDRARGIAVDNAGNTYLAGATFSNDFPTTVGALDRSLGGGRDAWVAKLNAAGNGLIYSTYLGGENWDYGNCLTIDDAGHAYIGGFTHGGFPVTTGAAQTTFGGSGDGFAARLSLDGSTLLYSTYLGGYSWDLVDGIAVDNAGNAYLAAHTHSTDFPTTSGAWDRVCDNCETNVKVDAAVAKVSADGSRFVYSTLVGGANTPAFANFTGIAIDDAGNAYLVGLSNSTDYPTTPNALQRSFSGGESDAVVTKLNADGSGLLYSTYLGGSGADRGYDIAIDGNGHAYVTGYTASTDFPAVDPLQAANAGGYDAFLAIMNGDGSALRYSTYLGGSGDDRCPDSPDASSPHIALHGAGAIYLAGCTGSADFPTTANAYDRSFNGGTYDAFVTRLNVATTRTWHIATNGSDTTGNGSEAKPFATIQHGINVASHGDTVLAHPGVYRDNIDFKGKNITVGSLFATTGNQDYILQTVIDGHRNDRVVTFANGEAATATLSGFTITNGYAHGDPGTYAAGGGGIGCISSHPTLTHLKITGNEALAWGGGLYFAYCSPTIRNVEITDNRAGDDGGGILFGYSSADVENAVISHNSTRNGGAGMFFYWTDGLVRNALIADNIDNDQNSHRGGGGVMFDGGSPTFVNVTVVGNRTTGGGGGLNVSYMSQPTLVNSIVWGNTPEQIYFEPDWPGQAITIEYSDVQGGETGIITNGQGPVHWGDGNIDSSPLFVYADLGNYRLSNSSPCIGAGKAEGAPSTDIEGNPRPNPAGSNPDMGAYENSRSLPVPKVYLPFVLNAFRSTPSAAKLYFAAGDVLYQMNLDGSGVEAVASGLASRNQGLVADPVHNKIYVGGWSQPTQIQVLDLTTGNLSAFSDGPGDGGQGIAIDLMGNRMYLGLYYNGVYAMNMGTSGNWTQLVDSAALQPMHGQRGQLQIDPDSQHIYFRTSYNGDCNECRYIWRVGFDGSGLKKVIPANGGDALALDLTERKMYFSDVPGEGTIKRVSMYLNPDGSSPEKITLFTLPEPYRFCRTIQLDVENKKMYLSLYNEDTVYRDRAIARMNMDGTGFEILHTLTGSDWLDIHGEMTLFLPDQTPTPAPFLVKYDFEGDFLASGTVRDRSGNAYTRK